MYFMPGLQNQGPNLSLTNSINEFSEDVFERGI